MITVLWSYNKESKVIQPNLKNVQPTHGNLFFELSYQSSFTHVYYGSLVEALPVKCELVILLDKDVEGPVVGVPGVPELYGAAGHRPIHHQLQLGRHWEEARDRLGRLVLPLDVAVAVALDMLHASGGQCAHAGRGLTPAPSQRLPPGVGSLSAARQRLGLQRCDQQRTGRWRRWRLRRVGVRTVAVCVERLSLVPVNVARVRSTHHTGLTGHSKPSSLNIQ